MKQMTEGELRQLITEAYKRGARAVEPEDGFTFLPFGSEKSDQSDLDAYVEEVMSKL